MTMSEDLNIVQADDFQESSSAGPVVFGISFTPKIIGILVGVLGFGGGAYMLLNMAMPAWDTYQQQQTKKNDLQVQIDQKKATTSQINQVKQQVAQAKQEQIQVLTLFANEKTLDTLLLDLNRLVESGNTQLPPNAVRSELKRFVPTSTKPEPITDSSYGTLVNGKLKRTTINVDIIGTYEQTQSILRNIERLQPLLIVKNYQSNLAPEAPSTPENPLRRVGPAPITTSFQLEALMPVNPSEQTADKPK
jgi:type IV pilus assembly protein PilO